MKSESLLAAAEVAAAALAGEVTNTTVTIQDENGNDVQVPVTVTIQNGEVTIIPVDNSSAFAGVTSPQRWCWALNSSAQIVAVPPMVRSKAPMSSLRPGRWR